MKNRFFSFIAGALAMFMLAVLPVTAMTSDGSLSLKVFPINILVNGETFQPKDANGNDVMVFTVNGTTYAPLRALAEAYGLDVGYDAKANTATVTNPAKVSGTLTAADSFTSVWTVNEKPVTHYGSEKIFTATYNGPLGENEFKTWWKSQSADEIEREANRLAAETQRLNPGYYVTMYFSYGQHNLGTAFAYGNNEFSNFDIASVWIK